MRESVLTFGNRTAVITGGSKNIGLAIAGKFRDAGMQVALVSSNREHLAEAIERLGGADASVSSWACDISQTDLLDSLFAQVAARHGSIDVLVNCAGILDLESVEDTTEETWDAVLDLNLKAAFFMVQKSLSYLKKGSSPRVINISSNAGRMGGYANGLAYTSSKGGMIALTYGLARRLGVCGITVNCIAPGTIESDMSRMRDGETMRKLLEKFPLGRIGTAQEVAAAACYFASIESSFTTGAVLDVNGGLFTG